MTKVALSDVGLRSLKPPEKGQISYWDTSLPSFGCRVSQGGSKTFILNRKNSLITIGRFPTISLSQARTEAKRLLAEFTLGKVRPQSITYKTAVELFLEEKEKARRGSTVEAYKGLLNRLNFSGQLTEITGDEVRRKLKQRTNYNHYLVALKVFFNFCIKRRYIEHNPTLGLSAERRPTRARVLTDSELKLIWRACEHRGFSSPNGVRLNTNHQSGNGPERGPALPASFCKIVQLLILTGQRRNEIASLQFSWLTTNGTIKDQGRGGGAKTQAATGNQNTPDNLWTITLPASVTKNGREHAFPLGSSAQQILKHCVSGSHFIFPARGSDGLKPFNGWSKSKVALDKLTGLTNWTLHDVRRTYRTIHARIGTPPHIAERLVNHVSSRSAMEEIYDRHTYLDEMRKAVDSFDSYMKDLLVG